MGMLMGLWIWQLPCLAFAAGNFLEELSDVYCGSGEMSFSFPVGFEDFASGIVVLDNMDKSHILQNDTACGLWMEERTDKTLLVTATYDGCYVRNEDEEYVMTVILDRMNNGEVDHYKKDIKCPLKQAFPAMDAPSAGDCAAIQRSDQLACADNSVSRDVCEQLGCCFSRNDHSLACYFGNKVTAQCTGNGLVVIAVSKDVTIPPLILDSARVVNLDSSCPGTSVSRTSAFVSFMFPLSCSVRQTTANGIVYENTVEVAKGITTWQGVSITRDSMMRLLVRCSFSQTGAAPLSVQVVTLPPPLPVSTKGPLFLEMKLADDSAYTSYYQDKDYPITKVLREPVYVEVVLLRRKDPSLVLVLNNCWATPSPDPTHQMQWSLIVNGCPYTEEESEYLTLLATVPTTIDFPNYYKHFIVSMFVFVDQTTQKAFSHEVSNNIFA
ncbi:zona pellucida sperm-binding protein 4-like [Pyxicephalus adspersus]|uniref:zona pellucida sperm-binding protein 4-like n=1 Tax=Pyxicephalus adspersus TaxID=30357 RepID=UPI003B5B2B77